MYERFEVGTATVRGGTGLETFEVERFTLETEGATIERWSILQLPAVVAERLGHSAPGLIYEWPNGCRGALSRGPLHERIRAHFGLPADGRRNFGGSGR